jgi:hypothetical protein
MNRRTLLVGSALAVVLRPAVGIASHVRSDVELCALIAAFFRAGEESPASDAGRLAREAAQLWTEGEMDAFCEVLGRGIRHLAQRGAQ